VDQEEIDPKKLNKRENFFVKDEIKWDGIERDILSFLLCQEMK